MLSGQLCKQQPSPTFNVADQCIGRLALCILSQAGIVARGHGIGAVRACPLHQGPKLDVAVASQIRVGRQAPTALRHKAAEHPAVAKTQGSSRLKVTFGDAMPLQDR